MPPISRAEGDRRQPAITASRDSHQMNRGFITKRVFGARVAF